MVFLRITCSFVVLAGLCAAAYAHEPVPGPDFEGCAPMGSGTTPYAPQPSINISIPGGAITKWPAGTYDFCAYFDTAYCSLAPLVQANVDPRIAEFADILQCISCDLNGPLNPAEEIPFTGNGFLDGPCELAVVAAVLNNPDHPLYAEATQKFQANVFEAKELLIAALSNVPGKGDLRPIVKMLAPHLTSALSCIVAAFALLGDEQTFDAMDELLNTLSMLGMAPVPGGIKAIMSGVPALNLDGDANGDGFTNREAYYYYVEHKGLDCADFALLAADPDEQIRLAEVKGGGAFLVGDSLMLTLEHEAPLLEFVDGDHGFTWSINGKVVPDQSERNFIISSLDVTDSGVYTLRFQARVLLGDKKSDIHLFELNTEVEVSWPVPLYSSASILLIVMAGIIVISLFPIYLQPTRALFKK